MCKMQWPKTLLLLLTPSWAGSFSTALPTTSSFVVSSTEPNKEVANPSNANDSDANPQIYSMEIQANVSNRFATTLITSKVRNLKRSPAETTFSVILPENAFISEFAMEVDGKSFKAYVKEKKEARKIYDQAVASGQSAAHVELSARDSKTFTVSVNIEPESKTIFKLTYEELLQRQIGQYELIVNIHPGQIVDDLSVKVYINESRPLTFVKTPSLRTGNEISKNDDKLDPSADIQLINSTSAIVRFNPDKDEQKKFAQLLGSKKEGGFSGQFIVQYDVERDPQGGEVLVRDGYFVHFFSPSELKSLPKHIVFVLDHSGSMLGTKFIQLVEAMQHILSDLSINDRFNIIRFSDGASTWNIETNKFEDVNVPSKNYGNLEIELKQLKLPPAVEAIKENIEKAKTVITDNSNMGLTNIIAGLEVGLFLVKKIREEFPSKFQPMIIFLTDGFPNVGISSGDQITKTVTKLNSGPIRAPIYSLSFGTGADKEFLKKLSLENLGFSRHIYDAGDASLQLQDFYRKISSPLLSNVTFKYVDGVADVTKTHYPILFNGSELVVAGRTNDNPTILRHIDATCTTGPIQFSTTKSESVSSLERLWAYLTVQQVLRERETAKNKTEPTRKALELSLKYSFVTPVTSLVVVKPNGTDRANTKNVEDSDLSSFNKQPPTYRFLAPPSYHAQAQLSGQIVGAAVSAPAPPLFYYPTPILGRSPSRPSIAFYSTRRPTVRPRASTTFQPMISDVPKWLEDIKNKNENITTPQGTYKLGASDAVYNRPPCPKTPLNGTGECTILYDCPEVLPVLADINIYFKYFCPLNEYAGVCCPAKKSSAAIP